MLERLAGDDEALRLGGRRFSRAELQAAVDATAAELAGEKGLVLARDHDQATVLVTVLAAIDAGRPVVVADPDLPPPVIASVPTGTQLVLMTSGSSGTARPVARTLASWTSSFAPLAELIGARPAEAVSVAVTGPLHVSMHLFAALHALWLGAVLTDERAGADIVHATPTTLARLVSVGARPKRAVVAGAALPADVRTSARTVGIAVTEYYGAAELSFVAAVDHARDPDGVLRPFPGVEVELRDGELWARSPYLALGYAGTTGVLRRDARGFATVGDRADASADGGLVIRGRGDAAINVAGTTVLAEDVEATIGGARRASSASPSSRRRIRSSARSPWRCSNSSPPPSCAGSSTTAAPGSRRRSARGPGTSSRHSPARPRARWHAALLTTALATGALDADRVDRA